MRSRYTTPSVHLTFPTSPSIPAPTSTTSTRILTHSPLFFPAPQYCLDGWRIWWGIFKQLRHGFKKKKKKNAFNPEPKCTSSCPRTCYQHKTEGDRRKTGGDEGNVALLSDVQLLFTCFIDVGTLFPFFHAAANTSLHSLQQVTL